MVFRKNNLSRFSLRFSGTWLPCLACTLTVASTGSLILIITFASNLDSEAVHQILLKYLHYCILQNVFVREPKDSSGIRKLLTHSHILTTVSNTIIQSHPNPDHNHLLTEKCVPSLHTNFLRKPYNISMSLCIMIIIYTRLCSLLTSEWVVTSKYSEHMTWRLTNT